MWRALALALAPCAPSQPARPPAARSACLSCAGRRVLPPGQTMIPVVAGTCPYVNADPRSSPRRRCLSPVRTCQVLGLWVQHRRCKLDCCPLIHRDLGLHQDSFFFQVPRRLCLQWSSELSNGPAININSSPNLWQAHLLDLRADSTCAELEKCSEKRENFDHFAGPCDPGSQPNRAPKPVGFPFALSNMMLRSACNSVLARLATATRLHGGYGG